MLPLTVPYLEPTLRSASDWGSCVGFAAIKLYYYYYYDDCITVLILLVILIAHGGGFSQSWSFLASSEPC